MKNLLLLALVVVSTAACQTSRNLGNQASHPGIQQPINPSLPDSIDPPSRPNTPIPNPDGGTMLPWPDNNGNIVTNVVPTPGSPLEGKVFCDNTGYRYLVNFSTWEITRKIPEYGYIPSGTKFRSIVKIGEGQYTFVLVNGESWTLSLE